MSKAQKIVNDFKNNIINFLDELIELFPSDSNLIFVRLLSKDSIPPTTIMNTFIKDILPYKNEVTNRNDKFFLEMTMFNFDTSKANYLKILWKSTIIDDDDRQIIWKWFDTFIYLAEQYQKSKINDEKIEN